MNNPMPNPDKTPTNKPLCICGHSADKHYRSQDSDYCIVEGCPCQHLTFGDKTPPQSPSSAALKAAEEIMGLLVPTTENIFQIISRHWQQEREELDRLRAALVEKDEYFNKVNKPLAEQLTAALKALEGARERLEKIEKDYTYDYINNIRTLVPTLSAKLAKEAITAIEQVVGKK
jgi:hypothetical protein